MLYMICIYNTYMYINIYIYYIYIFIYIIYLYIYIYLYLTAIWLFGCPTANLMPLLGE